ncbi:hypothetical protein ACFIQF_11285 [Comamonas sp. J-3]|uniref:hypothetical protein n=1 Tax=Comamonas trifloxystrobinivorans TaxID=3350256 RepID=UPI003727102C
MAADPMGVYARIHMSPDAASAFYQASGKELLADYRCIMLARERAIKSQTKLIELRDRYAGKTPPPSAFEAMFGAPSERLPCSEGDWMTIRYDRASQALFYMHIFNHSAPSTLAASQSFHTFLGQVAKYKTGKSKDYVLLSSSATNLMTSPLLRIWTVLPAKVQQLEDSAIDPAIKAEMKALDALSKKYYFDVFDKNTSYDAQQKVYRIDEEQVEKLLQFGAFDPELRELGAKP